MVIYGSYSSYVHQLNANEPGLFPAEILLSCQAAYLFTEVRMVGGEWVMALVELIPKKIEK